MQKLDMLALKGEVLDKLRDGASPLEAAREVSEGLTTNQLMDLLQEDPDLMNEVVAMDALCQDYAPTAAVCLSLAVEERLFDWADEQPEANDESE